jgi:hypothetical protein
LKNTAIQGFVQNADETNTVQNQSRQRPGVALRLPACWRKGFRIRLILQARSVLLGKAAIQTISDFPFTSQTILSSAERLAGRAAPGLFFRLH